MHYREDAFRLLDWFGRARANRASSSTKPKESVPQTWLKSPISRKSLPWTVANRPDSSIAADTIIM
jgi:hypothetical protein